MGTLRNPDDRKSRDNQIEVTLTKGFWLGKYEVTQSEWLRLDKPPLWAQMKDTDVMRGDDYPATCLSWENAMAFGRRLTSRERQAGRLPGGWHYTLPTEAQWEYACRGGTNTKFSFGDDESDFDRHGWHKQNSWDIGERYAHLVGQKLPNAFGLHDMHGNVWEWCRDGWQDRLPGGNDPFVPGHDDSRMIRGGCFGFRPSGCTSAIRRTHEAVDRANLYGQIGFRVALCPSE